MDHPDRNVLNCSGEGAVIFRGEAPELTQSGYPPALVVMARISPQQGREYQRRAAQLDHERAAQAAKQ